MPGNRALLTSAFHAGEKAKKEGRSVKACPYDASSTDQQESRKVKAWLRGWRTG